MRALIRRIVDHILGCRPKQVARRRDLYWWSGHIDNPEFPPDWEPPSAALIVPEPPESTKECSVCFRQPVICDGKCQECIDWEQYWGSLTPQQQKAELESMARYTEEAQRCEPRSAPRPPVSPAPGSKKAPPHP